MFQKPTFGSTTSGFGSFNAGASTSSPFSGFKPAGAGSFGAAPAFGATAAPQPAATSGLFGATTNTSGLFGATTSTAAPAFGAAAQPQGFGFGGTNTSGGLFGASTPAQPSTLFGGTQQNASAFGAKPAGFGFGATPTTAASTGVFGASTAGGLFGQTTNNMSGGSMFGGTTAFGGAAPAAGGTGHVKYAPVPGTDLMVKSGTSQTINIKHHCITCMKEYENKSLEELRMEDYVAGRKGPAAGTGTGPGTGGMFSGFQQPADNKPMFGANVSAFGQPATTSAPTMFGAGLANTSFGQTNTFSFGNTGANTTTSGLFGANKPAFPATNTAGTGLFGATTTQAPAFGTNTSTFGFGTQQAQPQTTGLFGTTGSAFGQTSTSGFGAGGGLFGAKTTQATTLSTAPAFGATSSAFGTTTSTSGGLFGGNTSFGAKPAQTGFGFGTTQPTLGTGLGSAFQNKPAGGLSLPAPGSLFPAQPAPTLNFNTGNTTLGGGLGGFGNTSTLGGSTLGGGLGGFGAANNTSITGNATLSSTVPNNVHEQILALVARPYGDSPLYKDLLPDSTTTAEEALKPTNPAALKAVLDGSGYRVTSPEVIPLRLRPGAPQAKKSLFDGLEEADPTLECKLSLKPSRKRLVLRPKQNKSGDGVDGVSNRSIEEPSSTSAVRDVPGNISREQDKVTSPRSDDIRGVNTDLEESSEKHGSWLGTSRLTWSDQKDKPIGNDPAPRLYPELDKEIQVEFPERRGSWLTTKPLRKPTACANPDAAEYSVRELRTDTGIQHDKENIELSVSEDENAVAPHEPPPPPHPAGVKLTRPGYYTIPSLNDMISYIRPDGRCVVPHLTIGRKNYGNVFFDCEIDVTGLDLDNLVHFLNKEIVIYPEDSDKPPIGSGLNRRAVVTLDRVWPRDKTEKRPVTDVNRLMKMDYEGRLRRVCDKHDTKFIEYRPQTGSWVFRVEHFSKYGLTDSDEEDDVTPEVLKRQLLVKEGMQRNAAPAQQPPIQATGLGGLSTLEDSVFNQHSAMMAAYTQSVTGIAQLGNSAVGRVFDMDTTDENPDMHSMYSDVNRAYGVKSPTSELARLENRNSHSVQLMKASLYAETEMEDDVSVSTSDQLVPVPTRVTSRVLSTVATDGPTTHASVHDDFMAVEVADEGTTEAIPRPLVVPPHTIILKYHRKIPPFKHTVAGKLGASCYASMSVSHARHSRVGFGPRNTIVYNTTQDVAESLGKSAQLTSLHEYVRGRSESDWSSQSVVRIALGGRTTTNNIEDAISSPLEAMLNYSSISEATETVSGRVEVTKRPSGRRELLDKLTGPLAHSTLGGGVSKTYYEEVWRLCEALWAHDLENDGISSTEESSIVHRHKALLEWLSAAAGDATGRELEVPVCAEDEDETDKHSSRIVTLLLGGRVMEACQLAREKGDLNMAVLLAQASGDPTFRSLLSRQLTLWRSCGALDLMSKNRVAALMLISGEIPVAQLSTVDWMRVLHAVVRYSCDPVPSLEQAVQQFESLLEKHPDDLQPPTGCGFDATVETGDVSRRILDLRYELIRSRALNVRPRLQPECYTANPFDYTLCFLVGAWLGTPSTESVVGLAQQLSAADAWHYACAVLAYHPVDHVRSRLIRDTLSRHAPALISTERQREQMSLLKRINVPEKWICEARAHRALYENLPMVAGEQLVAANKWNAAHRLLMDRLLPDAVLNDAIDSLAPIVTALSAAAKRHEVYGWDKGAAPLSHYLEVSSALMSAARGNSPGLELESIRSQLAQALAACRNTENDVQDRRSLAATAELGSRLGGLLRACGASTLPRAPPDCLAIHANAIARQLADEASEACADTSIAAN